MTQESREARATLPCYPGWQGSSLNSHSLAGCLQRWTRAPGHTYAGFGLVAHGGTTLTSVPAVTHGLDPGQAKVKSRSAPGALPPLIAKEPGHLLPAGAAGPSPPFQPFSLHLEGLTVTDPNGLGDVGQGGVLPAGFKRKGAPRLVCSLSPVSAADVLVREASALRVQGVQGVAVNHSAA